MVAILAQHFPQLGREGAGVRDVTVVTCGKLEALGLPARRAWDERNVRREREQTNGSIPAWSTSHIDRHC
jgi:hypothetical protein